MTLSCRSSSALVPEYAAARGQVNTAGIAAALSATPQRIFAASFVYGPEGLPKNNEIIHYSTQAQLQRGRMFVDGLRRARLNRAAALPMPPEIVSIVREQSGKITAQWRYPLCRYTGFDVDFSFDGGTTWNAGTLEKDSRLKAFTMAFAWEPVRMRIRSKADATVTVSPWAYSIELPSVRDVPATNAPFKFIGGENLSPTLTGAMTMYGVFTLPASGLRRLSTPDRTTPPGSSTCPPCSPARPTSRPRVRRWNDELQLPGTEGSARPAHQRNLGYRRRNLVHRQAWHRSGGNVDGHDGCALGRDATGKRSRRCRGPRRVPVPGVAHTGAQMATWQEFLRVRHGYDSLGGVA